MPRRQTPPSTPRLSETARHVALPSGVVSTGWPAVRDKCAELGISFRPWQHGAGQVILAKRADGRYAATIGGTGMSIPRQVGKTFLVAGIVFALCLLRPRLTVVWTAHRLRTAEETFGKMQAFAKRKRIAPHILKVVLGSGDEAILFRNGSRILFGARERGFGRGFDEVDVLIFDEGQILSDAALDDMIPATNQSRQDTSALLLFMGTPPKPKDDSEVFTRMRTDALSGADEDTGWVEFGADNDFRPTPLPDPLTRADWAQVAKANPSFPADTPREAILRMRKKLGAESFLREGLGIWDEQAAGEVGISADAWKRQALGAVPDDWPLAALGLDMHPLTGRLYVAPAAFGPEPVVHVELLDVDILAGGVDAAVEWIVKRVGRRLPVVLPADSPATMLHAALVQKKVKVYVLNLTEQGQSSAAFERAVSTDATAVHFADPLLDQAVDESTREQHRAAGQWRFGRVGELHGAPLWAVTAAHFGAVKWSKRRGVASDRDSVRSGRESASRSSSSREAASV